MARAGRTRRMVVGTIAAAGWWMVSCRDIPAPEGGVTSVGPLRLPSPGLVVGDTMRDSLGAAAPLDLVAYDVNGNPLSPQPEKSFIALDSTAHLAGALLVGDVVGRARIVGSAGGVQSRLDTVPVTLSPDTLQAPAAPDSTLHRATYAIATDSVSNSGPLNVDVRHLAPAGGVEAVVVKYAIERAPPGTGTTLLLVNGNVASARDTTDPQGRASRVARLRLKALSTFLAETAFVSATASYRGRVLGTVTFTIIYTNK